MQALKKRDLTALLADHTPSLTDEDDARIDYRMRCLVYGTTPGNGLMDNADLAVRTCSCGVHIDGYYDYIRHLTEVA